MKTWKFDYKTITLLACLLFCSCMDDTLTGTRYDESCLAADETDMYLKVSVPRTYSSGGTGNVEELIETIDVIVFAKGKVDPDNYYVQSACEGKLTESHNQFEVIMPVGKDLIVHVFANCHEDMAACNLYNSAGTRMDAMLSKLRLAKKVINGEKLTSLPMHGYITGVDIDKDTKDALTVPVLRSVAAAQVLTNAKIKDGDYTNITTGDILDDKGKLVFEMRELYAFFCPDSGRVAADAASYALLKPDDKDQTRDVVKASLLDNPTVSKVDNPLSIMKESKVQRIGCLYLYENIPYSDNGYDQPDDKKKAATTRLVVGGVYKEETDKDGKPIVTYYRVDFTGDGKLTDILRNHKYTFSIDNVSGPGYDTPGEAATGVPINIYVSVIDWTNEWNNIDFSGENSLSVESRSVVLPRDANSTRSIGMESDVALGEFWTLSFDKDSNVNGNTTVSEVKGVKDATTLSIQNDRYKVEIVAQTATAGKAHPFRFTVTARKAYKDNANIIAGTEAYDDVLYIKIKNLMVAINITQEDKSPDDWGNGGDLDTDLGEDPNKPIEVNGLGFVVAKGNLVATQADGTYAFAEEQGYYSGVSGQAYDLSGGDYFCWNTLDPSRFNVTQSSWDDSRDPCRQIGAGQWHTPTQDQLKELGELNTVWGTYEMKDGTKKYGRYYGTATAPATKEDQDKYVFLPAAGNRDYGSKGTIADEGSSGVGYYWSSTPAASDADRALKLYFSSNGVGDGVGMFGRYNGCPVRCVRDK